MQLEMQQLEASNQLLSNALALKQLAPESSYTKQKHKRIKNVEKRAWKELRQAGQAAGTALRQANQQTHTFSCVARSIRALLKRLNRKEWAARSKQAELVSRPTAFKATKLMMNVRLEPDFMETFAVQHYAFEQLYARKVSAVDENLKHAPHLDTHLPHSAK